MIIFPLNRLLNCVYYSSFLICFCIFSPLTVEAKEIRIKSPHSSSWPQAAGPHGSWSTQTDAEIPTSFNVAEDKNILWRKALDESGQSGIAVWKDRLFLTIMEPFDSDKPDPYKTGTIQALCINANNGDVIWQYEIKAANPSGYMYGFSDSTSPTPITDGEHVWFTNAGGKLVCLNWNGELVWERTWRLATEVLKPEKPFPFNKQHEPFMVNDVLVNMEAYDNVDGKRELGWHYLYGLDKMTGEVKWISEDAVTHYNTPGYSLDALGKPTALIGRGGYHDVPEGPKGYSMIDLADGKRVWQTELSGENDTALYNSNFTKDFAVWFSETESEITVLNSQNGEILKTIDLRTKVDLRTYDQALGRRVLRPDFDLSQTPNPNVFPAWYTNIIVGDHLYFMCSKDDTKQPLMKRWMKLSPQFSFARVDLKTDKVEYLEVPAHYNDRGEYLWKEELKTTALNSRGIDTISDPRSKRDGWYWCFNGNPILVNDILFFTTMIGNCYTFRTGTDRFDDSAFIDVNSLGVRSESWSLNTPSFANGKLYHRTAKELICIGNN
ncbi:MAG: PQQ-binding-like beta-propeller repeat protein [Verrucomicrobia bacterium]|nr:PQQ-binding-like beta-propeller repeat protein [Verrucomicrobiota bacterium]MDA1066401.1 PQQ-binding-like beta-propeller repeat protein [Verrucomicrobiota bacterium]